MANGDIERRVARLEERVRAVERQVRRMRGAWGDWLPLLTTLQDREEVFRLNTANVISHTVVIVALVAAYVAVTLTGHDASDILGALGGYLFGGVMQVGSAKIGNK